MAGKGIRSILLDHGEGWPGAVLEFALSSGAPAGKSVDLRILRMPSVVNVASSM